MVTEWPVWDIEECGKDIDGCYCIRTKDHDGNCRCEHMNAGRYDEEEDTR